MSSKNIISNIYYTHPEKPHYRHYSLICTLSSIFSVNPIYMYYF